MAGAPRGRPAGRMTSADLAWAGGQPAAIEGLRLVPLAPRRDVRGVFLEVFKDSWDLPVRPTQWSVVQSRARALRGLHLHLRHDEMFVLVQGRVHVGLKDLRRGSPTFGRAVLLDLAPDHPAAVVFPPGVLHGWYFSEPSVHLQAVSEEYDRYRHDDNLTCHWADPELGLAWPDQAPLLSPEAERFGSLQALLARLAASS
jgi:dTDP-4-dehydrorhamnose 3,5-epimerase